jgi:putative transcriptional regulator
MVRLLAFALLLAACPAAWCQAVDAMSSILLISRKDMRDPFFRDSVVLVTHRFGDMPMGVILNRPTGMVVATNVPEASKRPQSEVVSFGGPVAVEDLVVIFRAKNPPAGSVEVLEGVYLSMKRQTMNELLARDPPLKDIRFFAGYAAWGRGQLEAEVGRGDWHFLRADAALIFEKRPETLWRDLEPRASAKPASLTGGHR